MKFLKNNKKLSFLYDGKNIWDFELETNIKENKDEIIVEYILNNELKIKNHAKKYADFDAYEWVTWFENISDKPTKIISDLYDADIEVPFEHEEPRMYTAYMPERDEATKIYSPKGSVWEADEFYSDADKIGGNRYVNHITTSEVREYRNNGGRSSDGTAPFFNIAKKNKGIIIAIGWTGQWNCRIERKTDALNIKTKIEDTNFRLFPGEKIRTSSFVMMNYDGDFWESQNKWRRFVKKYFSLIGSDNRPDNAPFCAGIWGGMSTKGAIERIEKIKNGKLPFEYIWMDAGWYGTSEKESPDEFEGDWPSSTGDWRVNKTHHPDGLVDVTKAVKDAKLKFLLWVEPERVIYTTPIAISHPEYFLKAGYETDNYLLNLGNEEAWKYCFDTLAELIEKFGISCYRQDFNFEPLEYWRKNDGYDRKGISEIKHIMGLYRLWDALLEKFPHLIIDNCASGGRRIDIETLRRSVPLWRSDLQCPANFPSNCTQMHGINFGAWMPYSGTGTGREWGDVYRMRSSYSPGMTTNYTFSEKETFGSKEQIEWIKKYGEEFLKVRPYLSADMYPLTDEIAGENAWCVVQYNRPEENDGIVQIFRREKSIHTKAELLLRGLDKEKIYVFTDADDNSKFEISGLELTEKGFEFEMKEKRTAKILFYCEK